ncbi:outer membrane protein assembly factor BamC [Paraburkholderia hayleyella]|uniref:outer membrane protein assembly factor BamC n=1 Tax=Paraburkholderia hayleyella TaxID=2152889 RepID=UPI001291C29A|nr:outer membrane protein assembly factor BamC [Paraburkholderia hayleyella]
MNDLRLTRCLTAWLIAGGLAAGCSSPAPTQIDYKSDSRSKAAALAAPPDMIEVTADQRSLPPQGGETSLSTLKQIQNTAPSSALEVVPPVAGMHIQRDGTESWLVIDHKTPAEAWPQIRRFWQEQGFLLVVEQRENGVMETDWNETHPKINDGIIRNTLAIATGNSYVTAERNKFRTRLEAAPNGGTYVFVSQKGMREALSGPHNDTTTWVAKPNDPVLETEYLKRLMASLALASTRGPVADTDTGTPGAAMPSAGAKTAPALAGGTTAQAKAAKTKAAKIAAENVALAAQPPASSGTDASYTTSELTINEPYERAWLHVGQALDRSNFTVDDRDHTRGLYFVRYADPRDMGTAEQGFWNQMFHGKKEKVVKQYLVNVKALTPNQTRIAVVDDKGVIDDSEPARQIMTLMTSQLR